MAYVFPDVELGRWPSIITAVSPQITTSQTWLFQPVVTGLSAIWHRINEKLSRSLTFALSSKACEIVSNQIEDSAPGYPRFSALVGAHDSFHICRRFSTLRARILLMRQDKLVALEEELNRLDLKEKCGFFLGTFRNDRNPERKKILTQIDLALAEYDSLVTRNSHMLIFDVPKQREILSLQNWISGNACISRKETAYLSHGTDLLSIGNLNKDAVRRVEEFVEATLIRFHKPFRKSARLSVSKDPNVYIYSGSLLRRISQVIVTFIIVTLILLPVIIITILSNEKLRMGVIIVSSAAFIMTLSGLTKAKTSELFIAGATYATVLVVFLTGSGLSSH